MALDIADLVRTYNTGTKALLRAAGLPESMFGDPAAAQAAAPAAPVTGGTAAPSAPALSPQAQFLAGAARYASKRGGRPGLLEALAQKRSPGIIGGRLTGPVSVMPNAGGGNAVEKLLHVAQHGPRAGKAYQAFDLGGGNVRHVYFTPEGKRKVIAFKR